MTQQLDTPDEILAAFLDMRHTVADEARAIHAMLTTDGCRRAFAVSASNLATYLALRGHDLRVLQAALAPLGVSTLGHSESHVMPTLDAVAATLGAIAGVAPDGVVRPHRHLFERGPRRLMRNTEELFGPMPPERSVRIMVTLPPEAATDEEVAVDLVRAGMDCARINCAHDDAEVWSAMAANVRRAARCEFRACRVLVDLAGRKLRLAKAITPEGGNRFLPGQTFLLRHEAVVPDVLDKLVVGTTIWINDGKLGGVIHAVSPEGAVVRVTDTRAKGEHILADQGINVPGVSLGLAPLTDKDLADLDAVLGFADIIGYSFVESPSDIAILQRELTSRLPSGAPLPPLIVKLEARAALHELPGIIAAAASRQPLGVMIARGDLAVEIGYERLAEIQEEILWVCEAAHVPVIWATQVLERFVKRGTPSRAEVTDAAMSARAECVMLNKGPYVGEAIALLDDVLTRMHGHVHKKAPQLRALGLWQYLIPEPV